MKNRLILTLVLLMLAAPSIFGQLSPRKNNIKINTFSLLFRTTSLFYERSINDNMSLSFGVGYKSGGDLPNIFNFDTEKIATLEDNITGFMLTPEFRWYLKRCDGDALNEGFYLAGFLRYNQYNLENDLNFIDEEGNTFDNSMDARLQDFGVGAMLGYQLLLFNKRMVVDFMIFGPRISRLSFNLEFAQQMDPEFLESLQEAIRDKLEDVFNGENIDWESTSFSTKGSTSTPNLRYGISIGYAF